MKYIIFDIDGTLANTKTVDDACFIKAFDASFQIDIQNQDWSLLENVTDWGITEEIIKNHLGRKPTEAEYQLMEANHVQRLEAECKKDPSQFEEIPGAKAFFNDLQEMDDIALGVATGAWEPSARIKLSAIEIDINGTCFSNSSHFKSRESITRAVIEQLKLRTQSSPEKIIYFGDGDWDYKTCKNLGIPFIGVDVESNGRLKKLGATNVIPNYLNKQNVLKIINL